MEKHATEVACGQCNDCRIQAAQDWSIRAMHEAQMHRQNAFITLTYNEEHLPNNGSLDLRVWQLFAKRMRKALGPFRYMHVGEYGENNLRPHYHALIFGQNFSADRAIYQEDPQNGRRSYRSPTLATLWPYGFHDIQDLTRESANYVCQYAVKKILGNTVSADELREKRYGRVDAHTGEVWQVSPETWSMSTDPGIGSTWFKQYHTDLFPQDHCIVNGREKKPPKYYLKLLEKTQTDLYEKIKEKRRNKTIEKIEENTPAKRKVRAKITEQKIKNKAARKLD